MAREVLPPHMVRLAKPRADAMSDAVCEVLGALPENTDFHDEVASMYSWHDVARRTTLVYDRVLARSKEPLRERLVKHLRVGPVTGKICLLMVAFDTLVLCFLQWWWPTRDVQEAVDLPTFPSNLVGQHPTPGSSSDTARAADVRSDCGEAERSTFEKETRCTGRP